MSNGLVVSTASRRRGPEHYRVDVVAHSVADVVRCAGGWIFDRAMQGWAVNVVVPQPCETRAIEILGATVNEPLSPGHSAPQVFLDEAAGTEVIKHRLSAAARVFKAQALIAARLAPTTDACETLSASALSAAVKVKVIDCQSVTAVLRS